MKSLTVNTKRRKQNHKISFQFLAPCTPAVLKGKVRKFLVLVRDWKECEARIVSITTKSERTTWFKATTRSARAKLIKILRILFVKSSNFVQETPPEKVLYYFCNTLLGIPFDISGAIFKGS